jgi:hypothetical protein
MNKLSAETRLLTSLLNALDNSFLAALLGVVRRMIASVKSFRRNEITPRSLERLERRLERLARELARRILEYTLNRVESAKRPPTVTWEDRNFYPNRRSFRSIETRVGTVRYQRWICTAELSFFVRGIAPLDLRLGLVAERVSPGLAHRLGRLAADLPQQSALEQLREQFNVKLSVDAYRRIVDDLSVEVGYLHDEQVVEQLVQWIEISNQTKGKHDVLLLVGRDGVHVPMRGCWKEAACATLAVYDRNRKRLGTAYLGEMPQKNQERMTERLTKVLQGVLTKAGKQTLKLRYVTDAGCLPQSYFRKVLSKMKHPLTGEVLNWSWGVDFFHACEYLSSLSEALFGIGTSKSQSWFREQRHTLRHDSRGIQRVIRRAAQQRRRHGLKGSKEAYRKAVGYLVRYRRFMDYAERRKSGDPIGSGITEAGCKVIFNQRMKQSGMRWSQRGGQCIVNLRTACRSGLWDRIWRRWQDTQTDLPPINQLIPEIKRAAA